MKTFQQHLQSAIRAYLNQFELGEIDLTLVKEICEANTVDVVWSELQRRFEEPSEEPAKATPLKTLISGSQQDPIINGVRQSTAYDFLNRAVESCFGKTIGATRGTVHALHKASNTYGYAFSIILSDQQMINNFNYRDFSDDDPRRIIGYSFVKK